MPNDLPNQYVIGTRCGNGSGWLMHSIYPVACDAVQGRENRYCCPDSHIQAMGFRLPSAGSNAQTAATGTASGTTANKVVQAVSDGIASVVKTVTGRDDAVITGQKGEDEENGAFPWKALLIGGFVVTGVVAGSLIIYKAVKR